MAASRSNTPASNIRPPHPKSTFTIEEWEAKAPLGDPETKSVASIKAASERRPPFQLSISKSPQDVSVSRPSTPQPRVKLCPGSRPSTPVSRPPAVAHAHALNPKQPVQTPQQFYDWFALIDRSVAHSQEAHFRQHLLRVSEHLEMCDRLVGRIDLVDVEVSSMLEKWRSVEEGGKNLQDASQKLLDERDQLVELQGTIGTALEYFQELEHATRLLNHPGESLVLQTDFLYMVERVDICIEFLKSHRNYKEAEVYLLRFQQCMTRAMTLIKMYFVGSLRALTQDVSRRLFDQEVSDTAQMHLLYTRFSTVAGQLAPLLGEFERRARAHPEELGALLSECHSAYFSARKNLLVSRLTEQIRGLDPTRTELVELTRAGCSYLKQLCTEEFDLYRAFFSSGKEHLYQYLETLCDYLYDDLRPRILHEPRLTVLCEVCTVLQALMVLDQPLDDEIEEDGETTDELGRLHIRHLLQMVLQDAQTRLFFKAQAVIQSEIRYYTPTAQDLAYPDKLVAARGPTTAYEIREKQSISRLFEGPGLNQRETWFPTLAKTVWVLSQLHDYVQPAIFNDLAQEAVSLCHASLITAADTLRVKSAFDGQLFLVRHFLILREITRNLDVAQKAEPKGSDVGGSADSFSVADTVSSVLSRTSTLLPGSLFTSLGVMRAEHLADAKRGIDQDLKRACEAVISMASEPLCAPLRAFTGRPASPAEAAVLDEAFRGACARDLRANIARVRLYVPDARTAAVLVQHAVDRVEDTYSAFRIAARQVGTRVAVGENGLMDDEHLLFHCSITRDHVRVSRAFKNVGVENVGVERSFIPRQSQTRMVARKSSSHSADVDLSVSRINRLLRPLRNKCAIFAFAISRPSTSSSAVPITYGSGSLPPLDARVPPPLDVLQDSKLVILHAHQESRSSGALARQIFAVTNAYRNVVQAAVPGGPDGSRRNVLPLTDICAASVGRNIRREVAQCLAASEGEPDETGETALVDETYESVPMRFRNWTLITHATSEIVDTCPGHPMLVLSLLGVALTHGLYTESKTFLRLFLATLIRSPRPGIPPPITHPLYFSYLVGLCDEWTRLAPGRFADLFTHRSFAAVTLEVLAEHGSTAAWTCKSITRLVQLLRTQDFGCFLAFLHGLVETLAVRPDHLVRGCDDHMLLPRLAKWTGVVTSLFHSIIDILASAHDAGLHLPTIDDDGKDDDNDVRDQQAALVCVATHCLSSPLFPIISASHRRAALALLRDVVPRSTTFDAIAGQPLARSRVLAGALRAHNLGSLERAFWACAVKHSSPSSRVDPELRRALDDASERGRTKTGASRRQMRRAGSARSPPRKRARRDIPRRRLPSPSPSSSSSSSSSSTSMSSTPSLLSSSSSWSARSLSGCETPGEMACCPSEDEERTGRSCTAMGSCGDFRSVLADALKMRKDLKAERRRDSLRAPCSCDRSESLESGYSREEENAAATLPSEGDVLDMFAYDDPV